VISSPLLPHHLYPFVPEVSSLAHSATLSRARKTPAYKSEKREAEENRESLFWRRSEGYSVSMADKEACQEGNLDAVLKEAVDLVITDCSAPACGMTLNVV
jgi:hypothetical protein